MVLILAECILATSYTGLRSFENLCSSMQPFYRTLLILCKLHLLLLVIMSLLMMNLINCLDLFFYKNLFSFWHLFFLFARVRVVSETSNTITLLSLLSADVILWLTIFVSNFLNLGLISVDHEILHIVKALEGVVYLRCLSIRLFHFFYFLGPIVLLIFQVVTHTIRWFSDPPLNVCEVEEGREAQLAYIVHVMLQDYWTVLTQDIVRALSLLCGNFFKEFWLTFFTLFESLPRKRAPDEVYYGVTKCYHIVSPGLPEAHVRMDGCIATRCIRLNIVLKLYMFVLVTHRLSKSEVDKVERVGGFSEAHHHVVWPYVAMHDTTLMYALELIHCLEKQHQCRFPGEFSTTEIEEILQARSE